MALWVKFNLPLGPMVRGKLLVSFNPLEDKKILAKKNKTRKNKT